MKKIFCIFLVVLILIMASVPCFAVSSGFYSVKNVFSKSSDFASYRPGYTSFQLSDTGLSITTLTTGGYSWEYGAVLRASAVTTNHSYFILISNRTIIFECKYLDNSEARLTFDSSSTYHIFTPSKTVSRLLFYGSVESYTIEPFVFVDVTDLVSQGLTSSEIYNYLQDFIDFNHPVTSSYVSYNSELNNVTSFYSNLSHLFDPVWNMFDSWSFVTVFVVGSLFICMMIFVVVLIIRRCRNI